MTEQDWLTSTAPSAMIKHLADRHRLGTRAHRKLRHFAVACCRQVWDGTVCPWCGGLGYARLQGRDCEHCKGSGRVGGLTDERSRQAVEVSERYADGKATAAELATAGAHAIEVCRFWTGSDGGLLAARQAAILCNSDIGNALGGINWLASVTPGDVQANLLRCLFGNPWKPVTFDPAWRTVPVLAMAHGIYEHRSWRDLPVLADALEEAGLMDAECRACGGKPWTAEQEEAAKEDCDGHGPFKCLDCRGTGRVPHPILAHCREEGPHARGCHVVDFILGKE